MKIELKKVNEPDGKFWYGIWTNGRCHKSFGTDLASAEAAYDKIKEVQKTPNQPIEIIKEETI